MFTLPVGLIAALALPALIARCRSATDPLPRAALALLLPAVLNVVIFVNHSYIHDYWWYYALPYVVLASVWALRGLTRMGSAVRALRAAPRPAGAAFAVLLLALAGNGAHSIHTRYVADRTDAYRDRGLAFAKFVGHDDAIAFVTDFNRSVFYIDAWHLDYVAAAGLDSFRELKKRKDRGALPFERLVAVIPDGTTLDSIEKNVPAWSELGELRRLDPAQVAAEVPALAEFTAGGIWVLTIK
jgi:hypothetical protein